MTIHAEGFEPAHIKARALQHMQILSAGIASGCSPRAVALYVLSLTPAEGGIVVSHFIEEHAAPGTFAEAVFHELAD